MSTSRARSWILTINNPTKEDEQGLIDDQHRYLVYQIEKGEEETEHIQAFVYYDNAIKFPKKRFPRAHIEKVLSNKRAIAYCQKEDTRVRGPYIFGEPPEQGKRGDIEQIVDAIDEGCSEEDIAEMFPVFYIKYFKGVKALYDIKQKHREKAPHVTWIWGLSGTGKTTSVYNKHGRNNVYMKDGTPWWNGYNHEKAIIIDDFDGKWPFRDLLRLLDGFPYQGQNKGGYTKINSPYIYITCEFPPEYYYEIKDMSGNIDINHLKQITRRICEIIHLE